MISIRAIETAIPVLLDLHTHSNGQSPSLPALCRTWGWRGHDRALSRNDFIQTNPEISAAPVDKGYSRTLRPQTATYPVGSRKPEVIEFVLQYVRLI